MKFSAEWGLFWMFQVRDRPDSKTVCSLANSVWLAPSISIEWSVSTKLTLCLIQYYLKLITEPINLTGRCSLGSKRRRAEDRFPIHSYTTTSVLESQHCCPPAGHYKKCRFKTLQCWLHTSDPELPPCFILSAPQIHLCGVFSYSRLLHLHILLWYHHVCTQKDTHSETDTVCAAVVFKNIPNYPREKETSLKKWWGSSN